MILLENSDKDISPSKCENLKGLGVQMMPIHQTACYKSLLEIIKSSVAPSVEKNVTNGNHLYNAVWRMQHLYISTFSHASVLLITILSHLERVSFPLRSHGSRAVRLWAGYLGMCRSRHPSRPLQRPYTGSGLDWEKNKHDNTCVIDRSIIL